MTQQQFIEEIKQLSVAERLALIETIKRSLREESGTDAEEMTTSEEAFRKSFAPQGAVEIKSENVRRLYGILKFENPPMTREEERELMTDYLMEKYR